MTALLVKLSVCLAVTTSCIFSAGILLRLAASAMGAAWEAVNEYMF